MNSRFKHPLNKPNVYKWGIYSTKRLPVSFIYFFAACLAELNYWILKRQRQNVEQNIRKIFPGQDWKVKRITRRLFRNYARYLVDYARFYYLNTKQLKDAIPSVEGIEYFHQAVNRGKGILLLTAHLGNWELGSLFFSHLGIPVNVVTLPDEDKHVHKIRQQYRLGHQIRTITIRHSPLDGLWQILQALKRNELVAMLVDRYLREGGELIDFFQGKAYFPKGIVYLAQISGATVLPAFVVKNKDSNYQGIICKPLILDENYDKKVSPEYVQKNLRRIALSFEGIIRRFPDQWYNFETIWNNSSNLNIKT
ncbi:MAG: lysophospholipid acyltransferase family protein [bacterium]